jgi:hypothetical protein
MQPGANAGHRQRVARPIPTRPRHEASIQTPGPAISNRESIRLETPVKH